MRRDTATDWLLEEEQPAIRCLTLAQLHTPMSKGALPSGPKRTPGAPLADITIRIEGRRSD